MSDLGISIVGFNRIAQRFDEFPQHAHDKLLAKIRELTAKLESKVQAAVPVDKGKLQGEVQAFVDDKKDNIAGKVKVVAPNGADHAKAAALEYGAHAPTKVKAHQARLGHFWGRAVAPRTVMVAAASRTPNIQAHDYLRGPLASMESEVTTGLAQALAAAEEQE